MTSPDLFPPSVPVDTSIVAANAIRDRLSDLERLVYDGIAAMGAKGATALELETWLDLKGSTLRPRLWSLCGNAPAGAEKPPAVIFASDEKRNGARVYRLIDSKWGRHADAP